MYYFVTFSENYADEFDLWSAALMTRSEFDYYMSLLEKVDYIMRVTDEPFEFYFGTNQFLLFDYFRDLDRAITVTAISDDTAEIMKRVMFYGGNCLPNFLTTDDLEAWVWRFPDDIFDDDIFDDDIFDDEDEDDDEGAEWE